MPLNPNRPATSQEELDEWRQAGRQAGEKILAPKPSRGLLGPNYQPTEERELDPTIQTQWDIDLSNKNPLPWQRYFDSSIDNELVAEQLGRARSGYYDSMVGYGVGDAAKPVSAGSIPGVDGGDPMVQALASKYSQQVGNKLQDIRTQNQIEAPVMESKQLARTGNMLGAEEVNKIQNFKEQLAYQQKRLELYNQWKAQVDAAKAQAIAGILSLGGATTSLAGGGGK